MAGLPTTSSAVLGQDVIKSTSRRKRLGRRALLLATWNVRSLVESYGGDARICRSRQSPENCATVDRKLDLLVRELRRYDVSVAAVRETKWFGADVWETQGYTLLHSGRPLPHGEEPAVRKEGVGIALDERATSAWREAGEKWKAVSSRIVTARLKLTSVGQRRAGGSRETRNMYLTVISAYAPTARAPPAIAQEFINDLQDVLDQVPQSDVLLLLGDFNARVGSARIGQDLWRGVRGRHGIGECNDAGKRFLEFCARNQFTIMNTWFQKKGHHLATWKHPATKQMHTIDYTVMRSDQRCLCTDVQVMRGANCWSDHFMVRMKMRLCLPKWKKVSVGTMPIAVHGLQRKEVRETYEQELGKHLSECPYVASKTVEDNWRTVKECIIQTSEKVLGRGRQKQPDWFMEAVDDLQPLLEQKNVAHRRFLQSGTPSSKKEFRHRQRVVKQAVDAAKEAWICKVAGEAEAAEKDSQRKWRCIRQLQLTYSGRKPRRPTAILKRDGELAANSEEIKQQWHDHFEEILNVPSDFSPEVIEEMPSLPPHLELDDPPTMEELIAALNALKRGKAGGKTGLLPEMLLYGGAGLYDRLLQVMQDVWRSGRVVDDWKNAVIVPIPKKGDLRKCDNWRGISLLDVAGKVFARVIQARLQAIAEGILPESQCGFRKGRGCTDMIFVARQLVEKCHEHNDALFALFVDLRKAYDSVPRSALWSVLERYGVPPTMLSIIRSFHSGMQAEVRIGDATTEKIIVNNGLRQGCTLAPSLFSIYFGAVVGHWRARCPEAGVMVKYRHGRKLVGDRTAKSRLNEIKVTVTVCR